MTSPAARALIAPIRFYQRFITPYTPATCRYYPTCSAYAVTALRTRGALVGTGLTIWRLLRCNPWSSGGIDHVPAKGRRHDHGAEQQGGEQHGSGHLQGAAQLAGGRDGRKPEEGRRERGEAAGSSSTVSSAERRSAGTDLDAPLTAARQPMIGRSVA